MALLLIDGFESAPILRNGMSGNAATVQTGRDGVGKAISGPGGGSWLVPLPSNYTTLITGFGFRTTAAYGTASAGYSVSFTGDAGATWHLSINFAADGKMYLRRGTFSGTIIGTSTQTFPLDTWVYIEMKATMHATTGSCIVKVDGIEWINFTGNTRNAGTIVGYGGLYLGCWNGGRYDDLYIMDDSGSAPYNNFIGERVIKAKRPAGNGAANQFLGSDGNSVDNYALVDEDPPNITDYVSSGTLGQQDLYQLGAATGLLSVDAVQVITYSSKSDSGTRSFKPLLRSAAGAVDAGAAIPLSTTWIIQQGTVRMTNPDGAAWTPANVNAVQAGVEVA